MSKTDEKTLRMAAIAGVLAMIQSQGDDPAQIARNPGVPWSQDHRRMVSGKSSLLNHRASRSPWK
ncbi:MAG: hypothetical protein O3B00_03250 [archaeon]|jgi:hypothetical protein|nr:hypothetical protein [archaeon]MDA1130498.1 hypothetical protein [archaeon]